MIISLNKDLKIKIGGLGLIFFRKGVYYYVGSAMGHSGSSSLINRVKRHVSNPSLKKNHWHVDYLLNDNRIKILKIYLIPYKRKIECMIAQEIKKESDGYVTNFGSSDCSCCSHLFYFNKFLNV